MASQNVAKERAATAPTANDDTDDDLFIPADREEEWRTLKELIGTYLEMEDADGLIAFLKKQLSTKNSVLKAIRNICPICNATYSSFSNRNRHLTDASCKLLQKSKRRQELKTRQNMLRAALELREER